MHIYLLLFSVLALTLFALFMVGIICPKKIHRRFKNHERRQPLLFSLLFLLGVTVFTGCASFKSDQVKTEADGTVIESHQRVTTLFDAKSEIAKLRASTTDKTQGLTVGSINEEASSTNAVALTEAIVRAAVSGAVKSATPVP